MSTVAPETELESLPDWVLAAMGAEAAERALRERCLRNLNRLGRNKAGAVPAGAPEEQTNVLSDVLAGNLVFREEMKSRAEQAPHDLAVLVAESGDEAFAEHWWRKVFRRWSSSASDTDVEDIAQTTITKLLCPHSRFHFIKASIEAGPSERKEKVLAYIWTVAQHEAYTVFRKRKRHNEVQYSLEDVEDAPFDRLPDRRHCPESAVRGREAWRGLSEYERRILWWRHEGLSPGEIGELLGKSENTVSVHLTRARQHLAALLQIELRKNRKSER